MQTLSVNPHAEKLRNMGSSEGVLNVKSAFSKFVDFKRMAFTKWRQLLPRSRQIQKTIDTVLRVWLNASLSKNMRRWQEYTLQRIELKRILQKVLLRWSVSSVFSSFSKWSKIVLRKRLLRRKGKAIAGRHETEILFKAMTDWYEAHLEGLWFWDAHRVGDEHFQKRLLRKCHTMFNAWREERYWQKIRSHAAGQVQRRRHRRQLDGAVELWVSLVDKKKAVQAAQPAGGAGGVNGEAEAEAVPSARSTLSVAGEELEETLDKLRGKLQAALAFRHVALGQLEDDPGPTSLTVV